MLSTFRRDKLSARKGRWKQFPMFGQGDVFLLPLSHAFGQGVLRASHPLVPLACLPTCTTPPCKAWADHDWEVSFCHVGFCESSPLPQCANSLTPVGAWGNDWWKFSCLPAHGLCATAPAGRYVPDTSSCNSITWGKPETGKVLETKINKIYKINQD